MDIVQMVAWLLWLGLGIRVGWLMKSGSFNNLFKKKEKPKENMGGIENVK